MAPSSTGWQACPAFKDTSVPTVHPRAKCRRAVSLLCSCPSLTPKPSPPPLCSWVLIPSQFLKKTWNQPLSWSRHGAHSTFPMFNLMSSLPLTPGPRGVPTSQESRLRPRKVRALAHPGWRGTQVWFQSLHPCLSEFPNWVIHLVHWPWLQASRLKSTAKGPRLAFVEFIQRDCNLMSSFICSSAPFHQSV